MFLITGANGFIGSALVWELLRKNSDEKLIGIDSETDGSLPRPGHAYPSVPIFPKEMTAEILNSHGKAIRAVIHMGACSSTLETDRDFLYTNNVQYSQKLWEWCAKNKVLFIYASSGSVYGDGESGFDEKISCEKLKPLNPYGESKKAFDVWVSKQTTTPPRWYGLRFFNVYGPNEYHKGPMRSVVHKAYVDVCRYGRVQLFRSHKREYQDGHQKRDFIYIKDVTEWIVQILKDDQFQSGIYNMGHGKAETWRDLVGCLFDAMDKPVKIEWIDIPEPIRQQYQYFTRADMQWSFTRGLTSPLFSLHDGVSDYVRKYLALGETYLGR